MLHISYSSHKVPKLTILFCSHFVKIAMTNARPTSKLYASYLNSIEHTHTVICYTDLIQ